MSYESEYDARKYPAGGLEGNEWEKHALEYDASEYPDGPNAPMYGWKASQVIEKQRKALKKAIEDRDEWQTQALDRLKEVDRWRKIAMDSIVDVKKVASPDAPTFVNAAGAAQSRIEVRFDLFDGPALFEMASVLHHGALKYGENNWRGIPLEDHLNHLVMHVYAYLSGDRSDNHLSHIMCRAMFAQAVSIQNSHEQFHPGEECVPGLNHPGANI